MIEIIFIEGFRSNIGAMGIALKKNLSNLHHAYPIVLQLIILALLQKWGVIYYPKSLWDFKSEITSLHFINFTLMKVISL